MCPKTDTNNLKCAHLLFFWDRPGCITRKTDFVSFLVEFQLQQSVTGVS